ncbi:MAG: four helix bundle protein [Desulfonatronovibrio sp. MSAO_Bac4]|nr:MAG: four helix bundle protein [Desulfonatronovibrio sp. MSAO_Bac4]
MKIERFEDIEAWRESRILVKDMYGILGDCGDFGFRNQIQRASLSIMSNIAEGFDRHTNKEFIQFLIIARGSCAEVRSLLYAGLDVGYFSEEQFANFMDSCLKISMLLNGFIRYLKKSQRKY